MPDSELPLLLSTSILLLYWTLSQLALRLMEFMDDNHLPQAATQCLELSLMNMGQVIQFMLFQVIVS
jgi:hypothetical protein